MNIFELLETTANKNNDLGRFHEAFDFVMETHQFSPKNCRGHTEDIISYFTLMSSEIHYYDIIEKMGSWTLMSSGV